MKTEDEIRAALETLDNLQNSRGEIRGACYESPEKRFAAWQDDAMDAQAGLFADALEWVLGINSDPETKNMLGELLGKLPG